MDIKNERFKSVFDYLCQEKYVKDQKELSEKIGVGQNTMTNIMNGKTKVSDNTLRKLNAAFEHRFNMQYLRGESTVMLSENLYETEPTKAAEGIETYPQPPWAQLIKENEVLNRELRKSIAEVKRLTAALNNIILKLGQDTCTNNPKT